MSGSVKVRELIKGTEVITSPLPHADRLAKVNSSSLLWALRDIKNIDATKAMDDIKDIFGADQEIDKLGKFGATVSFDELFIHGIPDPFWERMFGGARGEIYVIGSALDGTGTIREFKSQIFRDCKENALLPLGDGGMLVSFIENPRWFLDIHMLVMESDSDERLLGQALEKARKEAKLDELSEMLKTVAIFDPTNVTKVIGVIGVFLRLLEMYLVDNGDDHLATIHDFYLKHQAFGRGRHPASGRQSFNSVDAAYRIELTKTE